MQTPNAEKERVLGLVKDAFRGVTLGAGIGLRQGQGLDDYSDAATLAAYRVQDEKNDWSVIPVADLDRWNSSLSFFDVDGMRFHLPAYLVADLNGKLKFTEILFHLVHQQGHALSRFDGLSAAQRHAVRQYLLLRQPNQNDEFLQPMIRAALSEYWTESMEA